MSWNYGLIEKTIEISPKEKYKILFLAEVYYDSKKRPFGFTYVDWKDIKKKDIPLIFEDLKMQATNKKYRYKESDF